VNSLRRHSVDEVISRPAAESHRGDLMVPISSAGPARSNKRRLHAEMIAGRKNRAAHTWVASVFVD
jgi:hypothetical protein